MTVVVPKANRGPGTIDTGTVNIAAALGHPVQVGVSYVLTALMNAADKLDSSLTITGIALSLDGHVVWGPNDWRGGRTDRAGNPIGPVVSWGTVNADFLPTTVRLVATLSDHVPFGVDLSTKPLT